MTNSAIKNITKSVPTPSSIIPTAPSDGTGIVGVSDEYMRRDAHPPMGQYFVGFAAHHFSGVQDISTGTDTKVEYATVDYDPQGDYDNITEFRYTPIVEGYYRIAASVCYDSPVADKYFRVAIKLTGSNRYISPVTVSVAVTQGHAPAIPPIYMNGSSDYLEVWTYHNFGVDKALTAALQYNYFSAYLIR